MHSPLLACWRTPYTCIVVQVGAMICTDGRQALSGEDEASHVAVKGGPLAAPEWHLVGTCASELALRQVHRAVRCGIQHAGDGCQGRYCKRRGGDHQTISPIPSAREDAVLDGTDCHPCSQSVQIRLGTILPHVSIGADLLVVGRDAVHRR